MNADYLAFDLGAESGRAMLGRLRSGVLDLREVHRFANRPIRCDGALRWDIRAVWSEMRRGLDLVTNAKLASMGVDSWGVDYALLNDRDELIENPYHYRDARTDGMMQAVFARVSKEEIYAITGIQFLPINTLYQLFAACRLTPEKVRAATRLTTIPDLMNYWLTGRLVSEYTNATTTQLVDARTRAWATGLMGRLDLPARLFAPILQAGNAIGVLQKGVSAAHAGTPVTAPACHDTGSAVAAASLNEATAFLSSGTWSLLGAELTSPIITEEARHANFTNEGGVCGTTRFLKNIAGLWLLQSCQRAWSEDGQTFTYQELLDAAQKEQSFQTLFDPDDAAFLNPPNMPWAIADYCNRTRQPAPANPPAFARAIFESLAFKYRVALESLERLTGCHFAEIRLMGGGSKNRLLNQMTAEATGRPVIAGPTEATALGNIAMQMLATGAVANLTEARRIIDRSFPAERFAPREAPEWNLNYARFLNYVQDGDQHARNKIE